MLVVTEASWNGVSNGPRDCATTEMLATAGVANTASPAMTSPMSVPNALVAPRRESHHETAIVATTPMPVTTTAGPSHPGKPVPEAGNRKTAYPTVTNTTADASSG